MGVEEPIETGLHRQVSNTRPARSSLSLPRDKTLPRAAKLADGSGAVDPNSWLDPLDAFYGKTHISIP